MKFKLLIASVLLLIISLTPLLSAQQAEKKETKSNVPELSEFHKIIYEIWHNAYPKNDVAALRSYVKDVNAYAEKLYSAKLPGIWKGKQEKWNKGIEEFKKAVDRYNTAAKGKDDGLMMYAAEELHTRFENLVDIIRPALNEIEEFHETLYVIYHKYMPNKEYDKIKELSEELKTKAEAIKNAKLNKKYESKAEEFKKAADELGIAVSELYNETKKDAKKAMDQAVEKVYTAYQRLVKLFD